MIENYEFSLTVEEKAKVDASVKTLKEILTPKLIDLSPEEIKELPKMGEKTVDFVEKSLVHMEQNPTLVPSYVSIEEANKDLDGVRLLKTYYNPLEQLTGMISDSSIQSGSEAFTASLSFYNAVKAAAKADVPGAKMIYNDLKTRFPGRPSGSK